MQDTEETWAGFLRWEDPLEEQMAAHSSILAWRIPWTEEPGGLQFIGLRRVGHNWSDLALTLSLSVSLSPPPPSLPSRSPALGKPAPWRGAPKPPAITITALPGERVHHLDLGPPTPGKPSVQHNRDSGSEPLSQVTPGFQIHGYHDVPCLNLLLARIPCYAKLDN